MKHSQMRKRRVIAALLTTCFLLQQSMIVPAMATEIGGGTAGWVTGVDGVYYIEIDDNRRGLQDLQAHCP